MSTWYKNELQDIEKNFKTTREKGLTTNQAEAFFEEFGENAIKEGERRSPVVIFFSQFLEMMVIILMIAAIVSLAMGEIIDAVVILIIVILNSLIGFMQEMKAEKAMDALKKLSVPNVLVRRDGKIKQISSTKLVPGDLVILETGNIIPADLYLVETVNMRAQESALTGESVGVEKDATWRPTSDKAIADRKNYAFMGTIVTNGRGEGIVTETGMGTEIGKIAGMLGRVQEEKTPLQKRLAKLGVILALAALFLITISSVVSILNGNGWKITFMTAISLAVAAIPEGLPAIVTITLALGARSMLKKQALIRNLPAVETLGSVTVICSDKTGTLTRNQMTVTSLWVPGGEVIDFDSFDGANSSHRLTVAGLALCSDSVISGDANIANLQTTGDPTEGALVIASHLKYKPKKELEIAFPRMREFPFDSVRKRMTTIHKADISHEILEFGGNSICSDEKYSEVAFTKGSVDGIVKICDRILKNGRIEAITPDDVNEINKINARLASEGIRVLGLSMSFACGKRVSEVEKNMVFVGFAGMIDPVRESAVEAVKQAHSAGIRVVMITGDHPMTALHIGKTLGIEGSGKVMTGLELEKHSVEDLRATVKDVNIFARVSPEHKMKLIDALQANGEIVSMTGDGVNDAPALKSADIGVAMGITGTDVSKQSSDMVLLDDNFATIVSAVKEGRTIFDNIKKFNKYILMGNMGEIVTMLMAPLFGMPLPLLPIQILWINLVTDGAPGIAMGYESSESNVMKRPPLPPDTGMFSGGIGRQIIMYGFLGGLVSLLAGWLFKSSPAWQTMVFTTLTFCQVQLAFALRRDYDFSFSGITKSPVMLGALGFAIGAQFAIIYAPPLQKIFRTVALSPKELGICFALSFILFIALELEKLIRRIVNKKSVSESV
ncbi:cation-translocating P-type ATPase [Myxococcota bacterium]|nr:cation-translocating P-type ATPase [Myxococcota bacterium]MBU1379945.1 cation-translocating P-type ATPase [Myxococcota bacterium]MBU1497071.1 cation-translocating P-type ATPase [Myxococcota bacterium]